MLMRILLVLAVVLVSCGQIERGPAVLRPHPYGDKLRSLNFPPLPAELQRRIYTKLPPANSIRKSDPLLKLQWGLAKIGALDRTAQLSCAPKIVVAVIDTGIDYAHQDLQDNLWINPGESGPWQGDATCRDKSCNGIDDDGNGFVDDVIGWDFVNDVPLPYDVHGHGTHVSGIIAARANDGFGIRGVCPSVQIMALKYYDNSGMGFNNLKNTVRAIRYAVKNGANIINYSGGGSDSASSERVAIEEAEKHNILFIAAAGNSESNSDLIPYYPANYPLSNILAVASLNQQGTLLPSSNFGGRSIHVAAPGLSILSDLPGNKFGTMSGTSQATAFVTGTVALMESQYPNKLSQKEIRDLKTWIIKGTEPILDPQGHSLLIGGSLSIPGALKQQRQSK